MTIWTFSVSTLSINVSVNVRYCWIIVSTNNDLGVSFYLGSIVSCYIVLLFISFCVVESVNCYFLLEN